MSAPELHVNNDYEESYQYALRLADALRKKHYPDNTDWRPLGDLLGLLTQIDNMVADLCTPTDERAARLEKWLEHERAVCEAAGDRAGVIAYTRARAALRDMDATP